MGQLHKHKPHTKFTLDHDEAASEVQNVHLLGCVACCVLVWCQYHMVSSTPLVSVTVGTITLDLVSLFQD